MRDDTYAPNPSPDIDAIFARQFRPTPHALIHRRDEFDGPVWMTRKRWARRWLRVLAYGAVVAFGTIACLALVLGVGVALGV